MNDQRAACTRSTHNQRRTHSGETGRNEKPRIESIDRAHCAGRTSRFGADVMLHQRFLMLGRPFAVLILTCLCIQGCTREEIRGIYDVQIEILQVPAKLTGTLILSTGILELPALGEEERLQFGELFLPDAIDANSCFILDPAPGLRDALAIPRVFQMRLSGNEIEFPIEIFRTATQRIEVTRLQFFAKAMDGEVTLYAGDHQRPGRISGVRSGDANVQRCLDALDQFRADLRASIVP